MEIAQPSPIKDACFTRAVFDPEEQPQTVSAEGVEAVGLPVGGVHRPVIPGPPAVVENDLPVEVTQRVARPVHGRKTSSAVWSPAASRSTSASVL